MKKTWVFAVAVLAGCAQSNDGGGSKGHVSQYSYDPALCTTLLPDTGFDAIYADLQLITPVKSPYFEKRYNRAMLEGVLNASGVATQKYVAQAGIGVYKVPYEGASNTCLFQHDLGVIPDDLEDIWEQSAGGDHGGGHLDGLFVAYSNGSSTKEAIMVREDSSRWTLVHEMMHANFFRQRQADHIPGGTALRAQVQHQYAALKNDYKTYQSSPSPDLLNTLVSETDSVAHLLYQSLASGSLEEIADESLLLQEWADGRLKYVSDSSAKNAAWYINYARTLSLKDLNDYSQVVRSMQSSVSPADAARFQPTLDFIASVNAQADELAKKASQIVGNLEDVSLTIGHADRAHVEAASKTPAVLEFRKQTADFLKSL